MSGRQCVLPARAHITAVVDRCIAAAWREHVLPRETEAARREFVLAFVAACDDVSLANVAESTCDDIDDAVTQAFERQTCSVEYGAVRSLIHDVQARCLSAAKTASHAENRHA